MLRYFLFIVCLCSGNLLLAQQFGGHPTGTRWRQINTDSVRVIFPEGYKKQAAGVAGMVQRMGQETNATLGNDFRKISIVLQPKTTISNGYVSMGPWRSEFYLTPPQNSFDLGSLSQIRTLALHEFRHVQQYNNFRKGVSKAFFYFFGQQGLELVNSAAVPNWFWEGDAVFQETLLSEQGRGRLPSFFNGYRSLWNADKHYSWMKLRNGSLRDYVPDHYRLGYMMVAYGREKYGDSIWGKITNDAVRYKGLFYPFQRAVKKYTGKDYRTFRQEAFGYFGSSLAVEAQGRSLLTASANAAGFTGAGDSSVDTWAHRHKHFVADESYPQWTDERGIIFVSSSYKKIPAFYTRDVVTGVDQKLRLKDISIDDYFSFRNGRIVYAAYEPDIRWRWIDFSVIKWLDVNTNQQKTLTSRSHYFSPDINEDGTRIVAVQVVPGTVAELHILNSADGAVVNKVPNPDSLLYTFPKFIADGRVISAVRNPTGAMTIALINIATGAAEYLLPFSMNAIGFPYVHKDTISFSASWKGRDRSFLLVNKQLYLFEPPVGTASTGQYQLQVAYGRFAWTAFTAVGDHIEQGALNADLLRPVEASAFATAPVHYGVASLAAGRYPLQDALPADTLLPVTKYSSLHGLFNFHSYRPIVEDPDYTFSVIGENVLNTMQSELFFNYNRSNKYKQLGANFTYAGLFPWIRVGTTYTLDIFSKTASGNGFYYDRWSGNAGLSVPLILTKGRYNRSLVIGSDYIMAKDYVKGKFKDTFDTKPFGYISNYLSFSNQLSQARQQIFPHLAQTLFINYSLGAVNTVGDQFLANANWYFPGLSRDHSLVLNTAVNLNDTGRTRNYNNSFPFSRGYQGYTLHQMLKLGVNYHAALAYPDWGFGSIVYFQRIRSNFFYDFVRAWDYYTRVAGKPVKSSLDFRSYGAEIYFDTKWWNQHNVTFGFRYSRLQDAKLVGLSPNQWEFIVPVNLLGR